MFILFTKEENIMKKLAVVTGASSGIGREIAKLLSQEGHPLLLLARRLDKLSELKLPNTLCMSVDVTDFRQIREAIDAAESEYGPVDLLVNNAGLMQLGDFESQDIDEWQRMIDVNVSGLLNGIKVVVHSMKERKSGSIINISSIAGKKTFPAHGVYSGTKFAVHAISEGLREELAVSNIRVTTIAPGAVETELLSHTTSKDIKSNYEKWKEEIGGALDAHHVCKAILFAYQQPQNVCIREIALAATAQQP